MLPEGLFLQEQARVRALEYGPMVNPVDGETYPGISRDTSLEIGGLIYDAVADKLDSDLELCYAFIRRRDPAYTYPTDVHHDGSMGEYAFLLYFDYGSQTMFVPPHAEGELEFVDSAPNRGFLFEANRLHSHHPSLEVTHTMVMFMDKYNGDE